MLNEVKSRSSRVGRKIAFRMDDVGASTKQFEVYSKTTLGNILFLKYFPPLKAWGPYEEITPKVWEEIINILIKLSANMTIAVTAAWVDEKNNLIPYPVKFPKQAKILKQAATKGIVEIANHGLVHCVVGKHLPRLFSSNRKYHREFYDFQPEEIIKNHLEESQKILQDYFRMKIVTFVPPGNVWTEFTKEYSKKVGLKNLSAKDSDVYAFHDRDIVLNGTKWLEYKINEYKKKNFEIVKVKDL